MSQISRLRDAEISNGNIINADDIDTEMNQLLAESNSQDSRLNAIENQAMTLSGTKTFSSPIKTSTINEATLNTGVQVASVLHKAGSIQLAEVADFIPSQNGSLGYNSTNQKYQVMENGLARTLNTSPLQIVSQTASYTLAPEDKGKLFLCTTAITLSLNPAVNLGNDWHIKVKNNGSSLVQILPAVSELINGEITGIVLSPGDNVQLVCDGTGFHTVSESQPGLYLLQSVTAVNTPSIDFNTVFTSDYDEYHLVVMGLIPAVSDVDCYCRVSEGGIFQSGATDYQYGCRSSSAATFTQQGSLASAQAILNYNITNGGLSTTAGDSYNLKLTLFQPSSSSFKKQMTFSAAYTRSGGFHSLSEGYITYQASTAAIDGIQILMSSGNIVSASAHLYGVKKY